MQVSVNQLEEWFSLYNKRYFNGELPTPVLAVGNSRTRLGSMSWRTRRRLFSRTTDGYTIRISNRFDLSEEQFQDILLHEMIHLCIVFKKIKDSSAHGIEFQRMMKSINADGRNITVSVRIDGKTTSESSPKRRRRVILAVITGNGKHILSVVNPRYVASLERILSVSRDVRTHSWHVSDDAYFASFPAVRTPKGRVVTPQKFAELTARMQKIPPC